MYIMKNNEFITINNRPGTHLSRPQQAETLPMVLQSSSLMSFRSSRKCTPIKYESNMNGSWISWLSLTEDMNRVKCNTTWLLTSREAAAGFIIDFLLHCGCKLSGWSFMSWARRFLIYYCGLNHSMICFCFMSPLDGTIALFGGIFLDF